MKRREFCLLVLLFPLLLSASVPTSQPSAIQYREEIRSNPPEHLHIATIDLADPRVSIHVARGGPDPDGDGPWQTTLQTARAIAARENFSLAINGNFFTGKSAFSFRGKQVPYIVGNWGMVAGWAMTDGVLWSNHGALGAFVVDDKGAVSIGRFTTIPANAREVVSSSELLLNHGRNVATSKDLAPRTAIGIDRDGKHLVMIVVDGRRDDYSVGMTGLQLADEFTAQGCSDAIIMDGGGSSTMVMRDPADGSMRLMNRPSDGHDLPISLSIERPVADVVGIAIREEPTSKP